MLKQPDSNNFETANEAALQTNAMLAYWDKGLVCRFANAAYLKWFNVQPEQMTGKLHIEQLLGPLFKKNLVYIKEVLEGKEQIFERDLTLYSGKWRSTITTYTPDIVNGQVMGFYVHIADVTGLKTKSATNYITDPHMEKLTGAEDPLDAVERTLRSFFFVGFPGILALSKKHFISESKLKRDFKARYNTTIFNYFRHLQMEFAEKHIIENRYSKKQMAAMLKFSNPSNFLACYQKYLKEKEANKRIASLEQANDDLHKILISQSPVAIAMFDMSFTCVAASEKWIIDYHLEGKQLKDINFYDIFPGEPGRWQAVHKRCLDGETDCGEELFTRKDQSFFWLRWNMRRWLNAKQEPGGLIVFSEDITLLKQQDADNKRLVDLLAGTGAVTGIGTWQKAIKKGKESWNDTTNKILELPGDHKPGDQTIAQFCKTREELARLLKAAIDYRQSFDLTTEIITQKGNAKFVRIVGFPEFANGTCEKIYGIIKEEEPPLP